MGFDSTHGDDQLDEIDPCEKHGFTHDVRRCARAYECAHAMVCRVGMEALVAAPPSRYQRQSGCECRDGARALAAPPRKALKDIEAERRAGVARAALRRAEMLDAYYRGKTFSADDFSITELVDDAHARDAVANWRDSALKRGVICALGRTSGRGARYFWANTQGGAHGRDDE